MYALFTYVISHNAIIMFCVCENYTLSHNFEQNHVSFIAITEIRSIGRLGIIIILHKSLIKTQNWNNINTSTVIEMSLLFILKQ